VNAFEAPKEFTVMAAKKLKKASSKPVSKSAFVRGLSTAMPAKEVVAKAKSAGLKISDRYVHVIRSIAKRAAKSGNGHASGPRRGGRPISSKRTFVLSLPASMAASEVIGRAKSQGMTLTTNYVYKIRSRGAAANGTNGYGRTSSMPPAPVLKAMRGSRRGAQSAPSNGQEERFVALVLDVGLSRATALLDQLRDRVQGLSVN
jgi:hypothetical protein